MYHPLDKKNYIIKKGRTVPKGLQVVAEEPIPVEVWLCPPSGAFPPGLLPGADDSGAQHASAGEYSKARCPRAKGEMICSGVVHSIIKRWKQE